MDDELLEFGDTRRQSVRQGMDIAARQELAYRELCRRKLLNFICRFKSDYKAGEVHKVICAKLEQFLQDVLDEKAPRLILQMPPRSGKSEIVSEKFPSWALGKHPGLEIIACSYALSLAIGFSKVIRSRFNDPDFKRLFPDAVLDKDEQGAEIWRTTHRGGYQAAGVGGPIVGRGANILLIDDPLKNFEEANSPVMRESVWNWYKASARTRLSPGGGVLLIMQRWHDSDLAGKLISHPRELREAGLPDDMIEEFDILSFKGIAEHDEYILDGKILEEPEEGSTLFRRNGEALHEERYGIKYLQQTKVTMGDRLFSALYQQNPVPDSGDFFHIDDFRWVESPPNYIGQRPVYITGDLAIGQRQVNDYSVIGACMYDEFRRLTLMEVIRGRLRSAEIVEAIIQLALRYSGNLQMIGIEYGQLYLSIADALKEQMVKRNIGAYLNEDLKPVTDKRARARPLQAWMQQGRLILPRNQPWSATVEAELLRFDAGEHDDCVDMLAWMVRMVQNEPAYDPEKARRRSGKTMQERLREVMRGSRGKPTADKGFMAA